MKLIHFCTGSLFVVLVAHTLYALCTLYLYKVQIASTTYKHLMFLSSALNFLSSTQTSDAKREKALIVFQSNLV